MDSSIAFVASVSKLCISSGKTIFRQFLTLQDVPLRTGEEYCYRLNTGGGHSCRDCQHLAQIKIIKKVFAF
jgi:hypothetical protein